MRGREEIHERMATGGFRKEGSDRGFGMVFTAASLGLAAWLLMDDVHVAGMPAAAIGLAAATFFLVAALLRPGLLSPLNRVWTAFGHALHRITNPFLLAIVFFGVILPIGLVMRVARKDPMRLRADRAASTYWCERQPPGSSPGDMTQQF